MTEVPAKALSMLRAANLERNLAVQKFESLVYAVIAAMGFDPGDRALNLDLDSGQLISKPEHEDKLGGKPDA